MPPEVSIILVFVGLAIGLLGLFLLLRKAPNTRQVGAFTFALFPAIIFFAIIFPSNVNSSATLQIIGSVGGPIAAYLIVAAFMISKLNPMLELEKTNQDLQAQVDKATKDLAASPQKAAAAVGPRPTLQPKEYKIPAVAKKRIVILPSKIQGVKQIDVIVNSENDQMDMARIYDSTISGALRYMDAVVDKAGYVKDDVLPRKLHEAIQSDGVNVPVRIGSVFATKVTGLADRGIKYVFHVATVRATVIGGYQPVISQLDDCVSNCFRKFSQLAAEGGLKSIVFPMMGTGHGGLDVKEAAPIILQTVVDCMKATPEVEKAYILAYDPRAYDALQEAATGLNLDAA